MQLAPPIPLRHAPRQLAPPTLPPASEWANTCFTVLLVDDDAAVRAALRHVLTTTGLNVVTAASGDDALWSVELYQPDLVITDLRMASTDGWQFLTREKRLHPELPIFVLTALPPRATSGAAEAADEFFQKPLDLDALLAAIHRHLHASVPAQPQS